LNSGCLGITTHSDATDDRVFFGKTWILFWPSQNQIPQGLILGKGRPNMHRIC
jgi:hypothetical protein